MTKISSTVQRKREGFKDKKITHAKLGISKKKSTVAITTGTGKNVELMQDDYDSETKK